MASMRGPPAYARWVFNIILSQVKEPLPSEYKMVRENQVTACDCWLFQHC
jgi:alanine dehydrogenase